MNESTFPELGLEAGVNAFDKALPSPFVIPSYVLKTTFLAYATTKAVQVP